MLNQKLKKCMLAFEKKNKSLLDNMAIISKELRKLKSELQIKKDIIDTLLKRRHLFEDILYSMDLIKESIEKKNKNELNVFLFPRLYYYAYSNQNTSNSCFWQWISIERINDNEFAVVCNKRRQTPNIIQENIIKNILNKSANSDEVIFFALHEHSKIISIHASDKKYNTKDHVIIQNIAINNVLSNLAFHHIFLQLSHSELF